MGLKGVEPAAGDIRGGLDISSITRSKWAFPPRNAGGEKLLAASLSHRMKRRQFSAGVNAVTSGAPSESATKWPNDGRFLAWPVKIGAHQGRFLTEVSINGKAIRQRVKWPAVRRENILRGGCRHRADPGQFQRR
jgi:hypothetical protein